MVLIKRRPDYFAAQMNAYWLLSTRLPPNLPFHGVHHTFNDVLPAYDRLADMMGIYGEELLLGKTAAAHHDIGFIWRYNRNETLAVKFVGDELPKFGYSKGQIERVQNVIWPTIVYLVNGQRRQFPGEDILEQLMCDADLDSLGRTDYFQVSDLFRAELELHGTLMNDRKWHESQLAFLHNHRYYTVAAVATREAGKQRNIRKLEKILLTL
jgi:hypothetical protein